MCIWKGNVEIRIWRQQRAPHANYCFKKDLRRLWSNRDLRWPRDKIRHYTCPNSCCQSSSRTYQKIAISALIWPGHCSPETLTLQQHCVRHFCFWQRFVHLALKVWWAVWVWIDADHVHLLRTWISRAGSCSSHWLAVPAVSRAHRPAAPTPDPGRRSQLISWWKAGAKKNLIW